MEVETSLSAEDMKRLGEAIDTAHQDQALKLLANPVAVHVNMLRGIIAKPSWQAIEHLYPEASALAAERDAATARAEAMEARANEHLAVAAQYSKQRDAATAERDRMREALEKAAIAAEVESAGHAIAIIEDALTSAKEPSA